VGNDKGVKSVFSGHWFVLLLVRKKLRTRNNRKAQVANKKRFARITGKDCLVAYLLEDCSGWIETSRSLRGEIHPAGPARPRTLSQASKVLQLERENIRRRQEKEKGRR
jgi:hypothetical protein